MHRLLAFILVLCCMAGICAAAEEPQRIETSLFTIEVPAGLNPDLDEFSREDFPFLHHIVHPITIQGANDDYMLMITLYDFPSQERHRVDNQEDKARALFNLISEYSGMTGVLTGRRARPDGDFRDFMLGSVPEQGYYIVTFFNQKRGEGYTFELHVKNGALSPEAAENLLLDIAASLREVGIIYPKDTGSTLVVTHTGINVRSGPDADSSIIKVAKQGETFPFLGENGIWYMIDVDGQVGYVSQSLTAIE